MKPWYRSRTIQLAILQAVAGVVLAFRTEYPTVGGLLMVKSGLDMILRFLTDSSIN